MLNIEPETVMKMKNSMKGIIYEGDRIAKVKEFPVPEPRSREVVVKIEATTICGSDMHKWRMNRNEYLQRFSPDLIHGHEGAGTVEAVGDAVQYLKKGDRVMIYHAQGCGVCPQCLAGNHRLCEIGQWLLATNVNGTFAEYVLNRETAVRKLPDFLSFFDGAMMGCCAGTSFESLRKLGVGSHSKLAVYGLGPVGLTAVIEAKTLGAYVIGVDIQEKRLGFGTKYGCDEVVDASKKNPAKVIMTLTNGKGVDAAFEASGNALLNAIKSVSDSGGRVCAVGWGKDRFEVPQFNSGLLYERYVFGNSLFPIQSIQKLMDLLVLHKTHLDQIVDTVFKLDQAQEAHKRFETYESAKIGFMP